MGTQRCLESTLLSPTCCARGIDRNHLTAYRGGRLALDLQERKSIELGLGFALRRLVSDRYFTQCLHLLDELSFC